MRIGQVAVPAAAGAVAGSTGTGSVFWLLAVLLVGSAVAVEQRAADSTASAFGGNVQQALEEA